MSREISNQSSNPRLSGKLSRDASCFFFAGGVIPLPFGGDGGKRGYSAKGRGETEGRGESEGRGIGDWRKREKNDGRRPAHANVTPEKDLPGNDLSAGADFPAEKNRRRRTVPAAAAAPHVFGELD